MIIYILFTSCTGLLPKLASCVIFELNLAGFVSVKNKLMYLFASPLDFKCLCSLCTIFWYLLVFYTSFLYFFAILLPAFFPHLENSVNLGILCIDRDIHAVEIKFNSFQAIKIRFFIKTTCYDSGRFLNT